MGIALNNTCRHGQDKDDCYVCELLRELATLRAQLADAIAFVRKAGHLPGCEADRCAVCGMSELPRGVPLPKDLKGHSYTHDFQPGPCSCGHDELVGV